MRTTGALRLITKHGRVLICTRLPQTLDQRRRADCQQPEVHGGCRRCNTNQTCAEKFGRWHGDDNGYDKAGDAKKQVGDTADEIAKTVSDTAKKGADEAQKAIDGLHGKPLDGRNLTVNVARPKEERPAGGGGGGRGPRREFGGGERRERY